LKLPVEDFLKFSSWKIPNISDEVSSESFEFHFIVDRLNLNCSIRVRGPDGSYVQQPSTFEITSDILNFLLQAAGDCVSTNCVLILEIGHIDERVYESKQNGGDIKRRMSKAEKKSRKKLSGGQIVSAVLNSPISPSSKSSPMKFHLPFPFFTLIFLSYRV